MSFSCFVAGWGLGFLLTNFGTQMGLIDLALGVGFGKWILYFGS